MRYEGLRPSFDRKMLSKSGPRNHGYHTHSCNSLQRITIDNSMAVIGKINNIATVRFSSQITIFSVILHFRHSCRMSFKGRHSKVYYSI